MQATSGFLVGLYIRNVQPKVLLGHVTHKHNADVIAKSDFF